MAKRKYIVEPERFVLTYRDGIRVEANLYLPETQSENYLKAGILFYPGFKITKEEMYESIKGILDHGYALMIPDLRAHGNGARLEIPAMVDDVFVTLNYMGEHMKEYGVRNIFLAGLSFGANIEVRAVAEGAICSGVVLLAPPISLSDYFTNLRMRILRLKSLHLRDGIGKYVIPDWLIEHLLDTERREATIANRHIGYNFSSLNDVYDDVWNACTSTSLYDVVDGKNINVPIFFIYGKKDNVCTPGRIKKLAEMIGENTSMHVIPEAGHDLKPYSEEIVQKAAEWADRILLENSFQEQLTEELARVR